MALAGLLSGRQLPATPPPPTPCGLSACLQALGVLRQSRDPAAAEAVGGAAAAGGAAGRRGQLRETRPGGPLASRCLPAAACLLPAVPLLPVPVPILFRNLVNAMHVRGAYKPRWVQEA